MKNSFLSRFGVCAALLPLLLLSCGNQDGKTAGSGTTAPDNSPINITVFSLLNMTPPPEDNKVFKLIKDKLGVTFTWDIAVGQKDQKIGVMIASQDYPDLINIDSKKFIDAGACIPLEDLIEKYGPNLKKHYGPIWEKMKAADGHIYCLPNWGVLDGKSHSTYYGDSAMWIQKAVLKEFGYPKITTVDDYFDLIAKYKAKYPTVNGMPTIGFTILTYDWRSWCMINPPNFLAGNPNNGGVVVDPQTFKAHTFLDKDISKRWFKKLNELNAKGIIDRSCFVDNYDQYIAKLASGRVLGIHDQNWQFQDSTASLTNQNMVERTMAPLPIVFDKNTRPWYRNRPIPNLTNGYGISVKAKDPIRIIKFLDAQLSEEWQKIFHWGIAGEDYQLDEKGVPYRTEEQRKQQADSVWQIHNKAALWYSTAPKMEGEFSDGNPTELSDIPSEFLAGQKPIDKEVFAAYGVTSYAELMDKDPPENPLYFPAWQITPPDGSPAQIASKRSDDVYRKYLPRIILANPADFEKLWAEYVDALSKIGLDQYEAYIQKGIDERIKNWSPK